MTGSGRRVVAVIQARMGSTRLPGKVLADVSGATMLSRLVAQIRGAATIDEIIVATTKLEDDAAIEAAAARDGVRVVRGDVDDVLARYETAATMAAASVVVRLTADCPLQSPDTVDEVVGAFLREGAEYAANRPPYTRPDGQDVEVFTRELLARAHRAATPGPDREHVTPWMIREAGVARHFVRHVPADGAALRWTVDHPEDLEFVRAVWRRLDARGAGPHPYEAIMSAVMESGAKQGASIANEGYYRSLYAAAATTPAAPLTLARSEEWLARSEKVVPGGAQTYSKSWRQHIRGVSPIFLDRGAGCRVWDVDGNEYVDLVQGLLPNILGYAHPDVDRAAYERAQKGHSFSLAHPLEVELAERLTRIIPCAEMVRFGKNGSDATAGAVRVARAYTKRERVAVCGYHGWQDWYIGTTTRTAGVPVAVRELATQFPYNNPEALDKLLASHPGEFAAVVMEPVNFNWPKEGYLAEVKKIAHRHGALLVFDEICSGFHLGLGGAQKMFGVLPDLAAFGKAMGNGYAISCVVGRRDVMRTFEDAFVSFTFAGDVAAMAASMVVLDHLEKGDAYARMTSAGQRLFDGARVLADAAGIGNRFTIKGHCHWPLLMFHTPTGEDDPAAKALWLQEVTRRGVFVIATHNITASLDEAAVNTVLMAYAHGFKRLAHVLERGQSPADHLGGPPPTAAFKIRG